MTEVIETSIGKVKMTTGQVTREDIPTQDDLTDKQRQVVGLLLAGETKRQAADQSGSRGGLRVSHGKEIV